jgi:REP element-mobilizing transposase RayT
MLFFDAKHQKIASPRKISFLGRGSEATNVLANNVDYLIETHQKMPTFNFLNAVKKIAQRRTRRKNRLKNDFANAVSNFTCATPTL